MNFMHFSMHHMQQSMQHKTAMAIFFATGFLRFLHFFWMYLIMARIVFIIAIIRLPKAAVPQWYQAPCLKDQITVEFPILPLSHVKYHVLTANARMIWPSAMMNSDDQKYTKIIYHPALKVVSSYTICRLPLSRVKYHV